MPPESRFIPQALQDGIRQSAYERYGLPIYITENSLSCWDWAALDGRVHDPNRIDFLTRYLRALSAGVAAGAGVRGYFHWALTDNFEWTEGYGQRENFFPYRSIPEISAFSY